MIHGRSVWRCRRVCTRISLKSMVGEFGTKPCWVRSNPPILAVVIGVWLLCPIGFNEEAVQLDIFLGYIMPPVIRIVL